MVGVVPQRAAEVAAAVQVSTSVQPRLEISHLHVPATLGPVHDVSFVGEPGRVRWSGRIAEVPAPRPLRTPWSAC